MPCRILRLIEVHHQTGGGDNQEELRPDRLGVLDPLNRLEHDPGGDPEQRRAIDQRGQNLPALVAVGLAVGWRDGGRSRR